MKKILLGLSLTVLLSACGAASVEDFMEDPEMLSEAMQACMMEKAQRASASEKCRNAEQATQRMARNLMRYRPGPIPASAIEAGRTSGRQDAIPNSTEESVLADLDGDCRSVRVQCPRGSPCPNAIACSL